MDCILQALVDHPDWLNIHCKKITEYEGDVAIIVLDKPITTGTIPISSSYVGVGTEVTSIGWGIDQTGGISKFLRYLGQTSIPCEEGYADGICVGKLSAQYQMGF